MAKLSQSFIPLSKNNPADAEILSHKILSRAGMIHQIASGMYFWLPTGLRVLSKIISIIDEEMRKIGAQECGVPCIQPSDVWEKTGRMDDYGPEMLKIKDRHGRDLVYAPTNEELFTIVASHYIKSFRDLPILLYTTQSKFRDEIRPRHGLMRGREFLMKDAYSFCSDEEQSKNIYKDMYNAYLKIFARLGLKCIPVKANSGPIGGNFNHEFVLRLPIGDSSILYDANVDNIDFSAASWKDFEDMTLYTDDAPDATSELLKSENIVKSKGVELGHLFYFGDKYSKPLNCCFSDQSGKKNFVSMGSYGIGVSRALAALVEVYGDESGMSWPRNLAPYQLSIISRDANDIEAANDVYKKLSIICDEILFDDSQDSLGAKFAKIDLLGIPATVIVSEKNDGKHEFKLRNERIGKKISLEDIEEWINDK